MKAKSQEPREEIANDIFYGIPPKKDRRKMSSERLAILLTGCEKDSAKYHLISHELNLRIVKEQNKPKYYAIACGFIGIVLGWLLAQWHPFETKDIGLNHIQTHAEANHSAEKNTGIPRPQPKGQSITPRSFVHPPISKPSMEIEQEKGNNSEAAEKEKEEPK